MADRNRKNEAKKLPGAVGKKAARRIRARRTRDRNIWFGVGMFGVVGWTIGITTLIGVALGIWIDRSWPGPYSWTLTLLFIGLIIGCMNAWYWVNKESRLDDDNVEKSDKGKPGS
jgi:ATP synthase protein I